MTKSNPNINSINCMAVFNAKSLLYLRAKKQHLEKKVYAMQLLVSSGFSGCEFRMYYPPTNNQIYICKVRARSFRLVFCEPKYEIGD